MSASYAEDGEALDNPLKRLWNGLADFASGWPASILMLIVRLWMAREFFLAGLAKIRDMENTLFLFEYEYQVPFVSHTFAAYSATAVELVAPVLVAVGLFTRAAAIPMLVMAFVIQFALGAANPAYDNIQHYYWMMLFGLIILKGPGKLSIDNFIGLR